MKTRGGSRRRGWKIAPACAAASLTLLILTNAALADATPASSISEPANAPTGVLLAPVPATVPAANPVTAPATNPAAAPAAMGSPTASAPVAAPVSPSAASNAPSAAPVSTSPASAPVAARTLALPAGTVAVPPLTGQTSTLDPNDPNAAGFNANADIVNYERYQNPDTYQQQQIPLQEFINEEDNTSPLGVDLREDHRKLKSGEDATGLLVVGVIPGSPAAKAGLHAYSDTTRTVLTGAAVAGLMFFPPAALLVPIVQSVPLGESYDLIIAVDGWRVMNYIEFADRLHDLQPGEIVYLSVIRNGIRQQIPVEVPQDAIISTSNY
ncbi:MAG TPA: PDZ domain-containing protein [Candidatus Binataceae bacterium]|nr:PDZ domain-containing protein [Candidatus Binataceae bacterium]